jgi:hypothetical protein
MVMTILTVTTADDVVDADDGRLSLREAVTLANQSVGRDEIDLGRLEGRTIELSLGQLAVGSDVRIIGDGDDDGLGVKLDGAHRGRLLRVDGEVDLQGLELANGLVRDGADGGAVIVVGGRLTIDGCVVRDSGCAVPDFDAPDIGKGGAIFVRSGAELEVTDSKILRNTADEGGGIASAGGAVVVRDSVLSGNRSDQYWSGGGAISVTDGGRLLVEDSTVSGNRAGGQGGFLDGTVGVGGGILVEDGTATILRSSITGNEAVLGAGIRAVGSVLVIDDSTLAANLAYQGEGRSPGSGSAIEGDGEVRITNSTITNNAVEDAWIYASAAVDVSGSLEIANSIVAGNYSYAGLGEPDAPTASDIRFGVTFSNGHNIFGSDVDGAVAGDLENMAPGTVFADLAEDYGGGTLAADGTVPLRASTANPALGGADWLLGATADQTGTARPAPAGSEPDAGATESPFAQSTRPSAGNDLLIGTESVDSLSGGHGHDFLRGLGGRDVLLGGDGGDLLEGGAAADRIEGGAGIDIASYRDGITAVTVDLRGSADTAVRGTVTDTLLSIEGAIGGGGHDRFWGDAGANWFHGGDGADIYTGGGGRDLFDIDAVSESRAGSRRDVITDFTHLVDRIDLAGIDADATLAGNQEFRWVGSAALSGAGEVGFYLSGGDTIIRLSTEADAASEAEIELSGIRTLSALDFHL